MEKYGDKKKYRKEKLIMKVLVISDIHGSGYYAEKIKEIDKKELEKWIKQSGKEIKKFFNTCGLKYKELNLKEKLADMEDKEKLDLLSSDGMLIKRPLLITEKEILIGFKEQEWNEKLKKQKGKINNESSSNIRYSWLRILC